MSSFGQFSWGFQPKIAPSTSQPSVPASPSTPSVEHVSSSTSSHLANKSKRRLSHPEDGIEKNYKAAVTPRRKAPLKKSRSIRQIVGQPLPTSRVIEVLDRQKLQQLLNNLIDLHPEISADVYKVSPRPMVSSAVKILSSKIEAIQNAFPYNVDSRSEYAYLRVKPLIEDFLNALSDYTLHFLPPVELQPNTSLEFLDQATTLLHQLPEFESITHNYFKLLAYEQLGHTWCVALKEFTKDKGVLFMAENWSQKVKKQNELCDGKLKQVVDFMKEEMEVLEDVDEIQKMASMQNFSITNSPYGWKHNLGV